MPIHDMQGNWMIRNEVNDNADAQVREVMSVNQEMTDESSWIWLTSEQMGVPLRSEFANENHGEVGSSKQS